MALNNYPLDWHRLGILQEVFDEVAQARKKVNSDVLRELRAVLPETISYGAIKYDIFGCT